jgi:PAS domain-containing protein
MKATISFFWKMIGVWFSLWDFPEPVRQWMRQEFIPGLYLARVAEKASDAAERHRLRELSREILARARSPDGLWGTLNPEVQADWERKAQICADLFQRSSSCVEGRNGQLSLKHHALHRFTLRKLQALTVLHNYLIRRADGTTAAERFYGTAPRDLFAWLLDRLPVPARPRARRFAA